MSGLLPHVFLSFQWHSSAERWLWIQPCSWRVCPRRACPWGLFPCARGLRCPTTTKRTLSLRTTSSECLWTCSTAHGISIRPDSRFGSCVLMTVSGISCEETTVVQWGLREVLLSPSRILVLAEICHMLLITSPALVSLHRFPPRFDALCYFCLLSQMHLLSPWPWQYTLTLTT